MNPKELDTPKVVDLQVIPVAGRDSMLLNLCGAHSPYFTRTIVVLKDSLGNTGVGEVPGGEGIRRTLEQATPLVVGKSIAGGIPAGAYGMTREVADRVAGHIELEDCDVGGIGGTLAGYALSMAAIRATLCDVLTEDAYERMFALAERWTDGVEAAIARHEVPWHVTRLGARAEYHFTSIPPRTGGDAAAAGDFELERFLHLHALNRGVLLTPFHNMALMSPATTGADVDRHTTAFDAAVADLFG